MSKKWTPYILFVVTIAAVWLLLSLGRQTAASIQETWTLEGHIFKGEVGDEAYPSPGVTVSLYGSGASYPVTGTLLLTATTNADGWYSLTLSTTGFEYYHIIAGNPPGYTSVDARSVGGTVRTPDWIEYPIPLDGKTLTGNDFWDISEAEVPLGEVPSTTHRYAGQLLEDVRGTRVAPGWDNARLGSPVRPLYRPDVEGVAYYEFPVLVGEVVSGFVIVSTGEHDFPIAHWNFTGDPPTHILEQKAAEEGQAAVKFYKLDTLDYAAEDESGALAATLGSLPFRVSGMDMAWLDQPENVSEASWTPTETGSDDDAEPPSDGRMTRSGPFSSTIQLTNWESWEALKDGYADSYQVLIEDLRREAAEAWEVDDLARQYGEVLFPGETYPLAMLCDNPDITTSGEGTTYATTELVESAGRPPVYRITALPGPNGEEFPLEVAVNCPGGPSESFKFYIAQPYVLYLPLIMRGAGDGSVSMALIPSGQIAGVNKVEGEAAYWAWAGTDDQRMYSQIPAHTSVNDTSCPSGCGATAWAMLFGWADYQAESPSWSYWHPRWGLYRANGGKGSNVRAPTNMTTGVENMTWEIRNDIGTWCVFGSAPTFPWDMSDAAQYFIGRTGTRLTTHYSSLGIKWGYIREYARNSILYRRTPAIIGVGWLKHYPLAYGYYWRSRRVKCCLIIRYTKYYRWFWVNQGWGGYGNGWVSGGTWFAGEIYP